MPRPLNAIRALIIDMDGVLWRGEQILPGVADFFEFMSQNGLHFLLATNNATRTVDSYLSRMKTLGLPVRADQILTSANATSRWLEHVLPAGEPLLVVGEEGLEAALAEAGFRSIRAEDGQEDRERVAAVVVGLDRHFNYEKLRRATKAIRAGARFIATNGDATFPAEEGLVPGAGSLVAAIETASGVKPVTVGKPHRPMFEAALELLGTTPEETAMLGDRLDTDIDGGRAAGLTTILVLTGVSTAAQVEAAAEKPDYVFPDLIRLREAWTSELAPH